MELNMYTFGFHLGAVGQLAVGKSTSRLHDSIDAGYRSARAGKQVSSENEGSLEVSSDGGCVRVRRVVAGQAVASGSVLHNGLRRRQIELQQCCSMLQMFRRQAQGLTGDAGILRSYDC